MKKYSKLKSQQKKLKEFIEVEIPKIKFWKPDRKPKKEWKVLYIHGVKE